MSSGIRLPLSAARARAVEIGMHPGLVHLEHVGDRAGDQDLLRASTAIRSQIVRRLSRSWVTMKTVRRASLQLADQLVEIGGADRIEPGGRLIEEDDLGIERQRRARPALAHAAGQLGRVLRRRRQAHHRDLEFGERAAGLGVEIGLAAHRHLDILGHRQCREQGPVLEHHAPALLDPLMLGVASRSACPPEDL